MRLFLFNKIQILFSAVLFLTVLSGDCSAIQQKNIVSKPDYNIEWKFKAEMPEPVANHIAAIIGDKIFSAGGRVYLSNGNADTVKGYKFNFRYDIKMDKWTRLAGIPFDFDNHAGTAAGGKVYIFGGNSNKEKTMCYDPEQDKWSEMSAIPTPRMHFSYSAANLNGRIYLIGGLEKSDGTKKIRGFVMRNEVTEKNEMYDPETNSWKEKAPLPTARQHPAVAGYENKVYVIGGAGNDYRDKKTVEVYDTNSDSWQRKADMPEARFISGVAVINSKIIVVTGVRRNQKVSMVFVYDPETDKWGRADNPPIAFRLTGVTSVGNRIYILVGPEMLEGKVSW